MTRPLDHVASDTPRRPRLLLSAYSCCPNRGSEPGIGWNNALELAKYCDTWVLTEGTDWPERINAYLEEHGPIPNLKFVYVPRTPWEKSVEYTPYFNHIAYRRWQRRAYAKALDLHKEVLFDLAHQLTLLTYRTPSYLFRLDIPFIWGPIGGAQDYPWRFLSGASLKEGFSEAVRTLLNAIELRFSPIVREASRSTAAAISANSENQRKLNRIYGLDSVLISDAGMTSLPESAPKPGSPDAPLQILWAGLLTTRKALDLLIEALALLPEHVQYELTVLGEGPAKARLTSLAQKRGVAQQIQWLGHVPHDEAQAQLRRADLFAFTSLRDTTGIVVVEALAASNPVICFDHQGVGDVVTEQCGVKIPVTNRGQVIRAMAAGITKLHDDRSLLERMSEASRQRAVEYLWSNKARRFADIYNKVLAATGSDARCHLPQELSTANTTSSHTSASLAIVGGPPDA